MDREEIKKVLKQTAERLGISVDEAARILAEKENISIEKEENPAPQESVEPVEALRQPERRPRPRRRRPRGLSDVGVTDPHGRGGSGSAYIGTEPILHAERGIFENNKPIIGNPEPITRTSVFGGGAVIGQGPRAVTGSSVIGNGRGISDAIFRRRRREK